MIGKLTGTWEGAGQDGSGLVDVGGVGYVVRMGALGTPSPGERVALFIHTAVKDDAIDLYGFYTADELAFFRQLMGVSGIGPKTALGIMGVADVQALRRAIARGEAATLTTSFGIGKKSAERLVVELRDKIVVTPEARGPGEEREEDIIEALVGLGYTLAESRRALRDIPQDIKGMRERLAAALRHLSSTNV